MGITSRKKRPIDRGMPHQRDTRLIIIAAEGEKTEKQYFESEIFGNHRVQVKVFPSEDGRAAPNHVLNNLRRIVEEIELDKDDQLWLVADKDKYPDKLLSEVCSHAFKRGRYKFKPAISNPCFELWLYLHHDDWKGSDDVSSRDLEKALKKKLGSYNKSRLDISNFSGLVEDAAKRARKMDKSTADRWPQRLGTHVYKLVDAIRALETGVK